MKVEIIRGVYVDGKACKKGDVIDTKNGNLLIGLGAAVVFEENKPDDKPKAPVDRAIKKMNKRG